MTIVRRVPRVERDVDGLEGTDHLAAVEVVAPVDPMGRPFVDRDRGAEALDPGARCRETVQLHAGLHHRPAHQLTVGPFVELGAPTRRVVGRLASPQEHHGHVRAIAATFIALIDADGARLADREAALADDLERGRHLERADSEVDRAGRGVRERRDRRRVHRVDGRLGHRQPSSPGLGRADAVDEGGGEGLGVRRHELVVDVDTVGVGSEHAAAHEQGRTEQLLAVVAGVGVVHEVRARPANRRARPAPRRWPRGRSSRRSARSCARGGRSGPR